MLLWQILLRNFEVKVILKLTMKIFVGGLNILLMLVASTLGDVEPRLQQGAAQPHQEDAHPLEANTEGGLIGQYQ